MSPYQMNVSENLQKNNSFTALLYLKTLTTPPYFALFLSKALIIT